jgi:hypothetical protein
MVPLNIVSLIIQIVIYLHVRDGPVNDGMKWAMIVLVGLFILPIVGFMFFVIG